MESILKNKKNLAIGGAVVAVLMLMMAGGSGADASELTCESIISDVIEMSEDKEVTLLEISSPEKDSSSGNELLCHGTAVWSDGDEGPITYGTELSPGGSLMIGYKEGRHSYI